ncbi:hypothetical protein CEXT_810941 [Caerostris extrusa]|uniref:Uncharacterized protein n=1 Tax=Caerostris extrusa TaxID=172846 RepID=A0AAV4PDA1_CAEEX|nr:hypothetical protein CEXT_810941 [Caerostris extrusa]
MPNANNKSLSQPDSGVPGWGPPVLPPRSPGLPMGKGAGWGQYLHLGTWIEWCYPNSLHSEEVLDLGFI